MLLKLQKIIRFFSKGITAVVVFGLILLVMAEAVARYFFNSPLMLVDEFGAYALVCIVCLGLAVTYEESGHISIDSFKSMLPKKVQYHLRGITYILATALTSFLIVGAYQLLSFSIRLGQRSESWLRIPLKYPQAFILIGFVLVQIQLILLIIEHYKDQQ
jgi:TRAP-type C4-dicarboxylate transport system permease small subunit